MFKNIPIKIVLCIFSNRHNNYWGILWIFFEFIKYN